MNEGSGHIPDFGTISMYSERELSAIHKWSPWTKLLFLLMLIVTVVVIQSIVILSLTYVLTLALYWLGALPKRRLFRWYLFPIFFVLAIAVLFVFSEPGLTIIAFEFFGAAIRVTDAGLLLLLKFFLRSLSVVTFSLTFVMTTKYSHINHVFQKVLPHPFDSVFLLTYRFSFVIFSSISTMLEAIHSRMGGLTKGFLKQSRLYGGIIAVSLIYSMEKAERIGKAMEARGYSGKLKSYEKVKGPSLLEWTALLISVLLLTMVYIYQGVLP